MKKISVIIFLVFVGFSGFSFASDSDFWQLPDPDKTRVVWTDKSAEVNNIQVNARYLTSDLDGEDILNFYRRVLAQRGWKLTDYFKDQGIMNFTKDTGYIYISVQKMGENNSIYVLYSAGDLKLCKKLVGYFFQDVVARDAEGKDIPEVPRYPNSSRRLNVFAQEEGQLAMYETDAPISEVRDFYLGQLSQYGWELIRETDPGFLSRFSRLKDVLKDIAILGFSKDNQTLIVIAYPTPKGISKARTLITITKDIETLVEPNPAGE